MRPYFENMTPLGRSLTETQKESSKENLVQINELEKAVTEAIEAVKNAGIPAEVIKKRGQLTVWERLEYLIDPGTWCPLHTLYNPRFNEEGATGVIDGLAKINGKWAVVIGFDNKVMAGAWISGQAENQLRVTDMAKRLNVPLVWIVNCSGVKLTEQEEVYADRRGGGTTFFRHAELEKLGVPIHYNETGFFKEVYDTEEDLMDALKKYINMVPSYDPHFFRVDEPKEPKFPGDDLNFIVPFNQKRSYNFDEVLARIFDNSEHMEFRPYYGPEVYTGLAKIDGFLVGFIGNRQGFLGQNYPEYAPYPGIGGKLYRQGLIKMNELAQQYFDNSRPIYCANRGFVDEIVSFSDLRRYIAAFTGCAYQNPLSICPHHHMMIPRIIRG